MEWLAARPLPGGYTAPSRAWVSNILIGMDPTTMPPHRAPGWTENSAFLEMTHGLGRDHNPSGLALADKGMNGRKEVFFFGGTPDANNDRTNLAT